MEREIEENIYKRFPSLGNSPERSGTRSGSRGGSTMKGNTLVLMKSARYDGNSLRNSMSPELKRKPQQDLSLYEIKEVTAMKKGYGLASSKQSPPIKKSAVPPSINLAAYRSQHPSLKAPPM